MSKSKFLSLILLLIPFSVEAEDVIHYTNGKTLTAKVVEVGRDYVKYRKASNQDGPIYTEPTDSIIKIDYENGTHDVWNHNTKIFDLSKSKFDLQFGITASVFTVMPQFDVNFGYSPTRHFRVGLGVGITNKDFDHEDGMLVPLFLNLKYTVLKKKFSPYIKAEYGYFIMSGDFKRVSPSEYLKFSLGVDWKRKHGYYFLDLGCESHFGTNVSDTGPCLGIGYAYCF